MAKNLSLIIIIAVIASIARDRKEKPTPWMCEEDVRSALADSERMTKQSRKSGYNAPKPALHLDRIHF